MLSTCTSKYQVESLLYAFRRFCDNNFKCFDVLMRKMMIGSIVLRFMLIFFRSEIKLQIMNWS